MEASSSSKKRVVLSVCAGAVAAGAGCLWLKRSLSQQQNGGVAPTDFDAFLVAPVPGAAAASASASKAGKQQQHLATSFESFLKVQPAVEEPCATDFASFLKDNTLAGGAGGANSTSSATATAAAAAAAAEVILPEEAVPVLVLYGTEYGFAREIAEKLSTTLKDTGAFWPLLQDAAAHPGGLDLSAQQAALLVFSTQGDGVPPTEAREFCDWLTSDAGAAAVTSSTPLSYSVCALGDTAYAHFCRCGKTLDAALSAAGAKPLLPRVDVDKEDWVAVDAWIEGCVAQLIAAVAAGELKSFAQLGGVAAVVPGAGGGAAAAAVQRYSKSRPYYARVVSVEGLCVLTHPDDKDTVKVELAIEPEVLLTEGGGGGGLSYTPGDALGIWPSNPPQVVDELLQQLGASGDEPVPTPSWHYQEQQQQQQQQSGANNTNSTNSSTMSLRHALTVCYDLKTPKTKALLQLLLEQLTATAAAAVTDGDDSSKQPDQQQQQLVRPSIDLQVDATAAGGRGLAAAAPNNNNSTADKSAATAGVVTPAAAIAAAIAAIQSLLTLPADGLEQYSAGRHVADMLQEFNSNNSQQQQHQPAAKIDYKQLLGVLRPLQPRLYSISSTPLEYSPANSGVAATIAVVRYTSSATGKDRQGVASTQVAERLEPGTLLPIFISKNPDFRLPQNPATPVIMVGPGTGLAPFRAFILHRLLDSKQQQQQQGEEKGRETAATSSSSSSGSACGPMHLFFGCRRRDQDFLYGSQLQQWHDAGSITLHTAFSREGASKVYVQQRLREAGAQVAALLHEGGGHFYVCGDAGSMAGAVEAALVDIIGQYIVGAEGEGVEREAAARAYLQQLADSGRYERDVWFS